MTEKLKGPNVMHNLIIMIISWTAASFCFILVNFFVKYMPGDIYVNQVISGCSAFVLLIEYRV